jgi:hypothetical protein
MELSFYFLWNSWVHCWTLEYREAVNGAFGIIQLSLDETKAGLMQIGWTSLFS